MKLCGELKDKKTFEELEVEKKGFVIPPEACIDKDGDLCSVSMIKYIIDNFPLFDDSQIAAILAHSIDCICDYRDRNFVISKGQSRNRKRLAAMLRWLSNDPMQFYYRTLEHNSNTPTQLDVSKAKDLSEQSLSTIFNELKRVYRTLWW
jgi:hypothetical protein